MADISASLDYRALFHQLPDNYLLLAPDGTLLDNSDAHVQVSLLPREQALGRHIFEAYPGDPQSQADLLASHEAVRRTLQPHVMALLRYDIARPAALGGGTEERYWQITHFPLLDARGALQFLLQQSQDLTDATLAARRAAQVQRDLDEATERTRFILESLPVMVWTNRADGTPDYHNARWQAYTGQTSASGTNWREDELVHPDDAAAVAREVGQAVAAGREYQLEFRLRRHDGEYRWVLAHNVPRFGPDGRLAMWVGGGVDVHDQKLMVAELLHANEEQAQLSDQAYQQAQLAGQQRQLMHNLLMEAPAMVSIVRGPAHRYEFASQRFQEFAGGQELVGRTVAEVFPEVVSQGIVALLDGVFATGEPVVGVEQLVQVAAPDGSGALRELYFNFNYQRFEENGAPAGITAYAYDVTELVHTRQALAQLRGPVR